MKLINLGYGKISQVILLKKGFIRLGTSRASIRLGQVRLGEVLLTPICFRPNMFWAQYVLVKYVFVNMFSSICFGPICFRTAPIKSENFEISYYRANTVEFRPADFLWLHPVPPKTQFGVKGTYRMLVTSSTTFEKSGFRIIRIRNPDPDFLKNPGNFGPDLELQSDFKSDIQGLSYAPFCYRVIIV